MILQTPPICRNKARCGCIDVSDDAMKNGCGKESDGAYEGFFVICLLRMTGIQRATRIYNQANKLSPGLGMCAKIFNRLGNGQEVLWCLRVGDAKLTHQFFIQTLPYQTIETEISHKMIKLAQLLRCWWDCSDNIKNSVSDFRCRQVSSFWNSRKSRRWDRQFGRSVSNRTQKFGHWKIREGWTRSMAGTVQSVLKCKLNLLTFYCTYALMHDQMKRWWWDEDEVTNSNSVCINVRN